MTPDRQMEVRQSGRPYPPEPEYRNVLRARVVLDFTEQGETVHQAEEGWARLDGPWLHWYGDQQGGWQSWPLQNVICIDWETPDA